MSVVTAPEVPTRSVAIAEWKTSLLKVLGLVLTVACWLWARDVHLTRVGTLILLAGVPILQFPFAWIGRRALDAKPTSKRSQWISLWVHYAIMTALGVSIFPAIRIVHERWQRYPHPLLGIPPAVGQALVLLTGFLTLLTILNLAIRGLGAPFAAKLSSRLATDWMYAWVRNPMGLCTFSLLLAIGLRYQSLWFIFLLLFCWTPGWIFFVKHYEERELEIRFGTSYLDYRAVTPFMWPRKPRQMR